MKLHSNLNLNRSCNLQHISYVLENICCLETSQVVSTWRFQLLLYANFLEQYWHVKANTLKCTLFLWSRNSHWERIRFSHKSHLYLRRHASGEWTINVYFPHVPWRLLTRENVTSSKISGLLVSMVHLRLAKFSLYLVLFKVHSIFEFKTAN